MSDLKVSANSDGTVHIGHSGEGWLIEKNPDWGLTILTIGASRIPFNAALLDRPDVFARQRKEAGIEEPPVRPVPLLINCPGCGERHIDEGEWANRAHHTHSCQFCGMTWRPAVVATVGVQFLPGFKNT